MAVNKTVGACIFAMLALANTVQASGWRGIIPLHSTRSDVVRLLGVSPDANNLRSKYYLKNEDVYIVFSDSNFCSADSMQVPVGTVLLVQVTPKTEIGLTDLGVDRKRLRQFDPSSPPDMGFEGYIDEEDGVVIRTHKGRVDEIAYIAAAKDRSLCPRYYETSEAFVQILVEGLPRKFDEYSNISFSDEKARLDNFAIYLQKDEPTFKGYVIVYPGQHMRLSKAQARAKRAKHYLVTVRGINAERIVTVSGGCRERLEIELYALPPNISAPIPYPPRHHDK
jgi:hypothetical protein